MPMRDLSQAEMEVMRVLWEKGEATIRDVHDELINGRRLAYTTISTMMMRLRDKGYLSATEQGGAYLFRPLIGREEVLKRKLDDLVKMLLGGNVRPLAVYVAETAGLTPEQIAALERAIEPD